jgi:hypothetical protein
MVSDMAFLVRILSSLSGSLVWGFLEVERLMENISGARSNVIRSCASYIVDSVLQSGVYSGGKFVLGVAGAPPYRIPLS